MHEDDQSRRPKKHARRVLAVVAVCLMPSLWAEDFAVPRKIESMKNPVPRSPQILTKAKADYEKLCLRCHGAEGAGDGPFAKVLPIKPLDLRDSQAMSGKTDGRLFHAISEGIRFMPGFRNKLTEKERWGLVHLLRSISNTKKGVNDTSNRGKTTTARERPEARLSRRPLPRL